MTQLLTPDPFDDNGKEARRARNQQIVAMRRDGKSLREIANIVGLSHETVALVCRKHGLGRIVLAQARALDSNQRERIVKAWREGEDRKALAKREGVYIATVGRVVEQDATERDREARRIAINTRRKGRKQISDQQIYDAVRLCGNELNKVPTSEEYRDFAKQHGGLPSIPTIQKRLTWRRALEGAGFTPPSGRGRGPAFSTEACWDSVRIVRDRLGRVPSIGDYEQYRDDTMPGAQTVRVRCGGWTTVVETLHNEMLFLGNGVILDSGLSESNGHHTERRDIAVPVAKQQQEKKGKWWKR